MWKCGDVKMMIPLCDKKFFREIEIQNFLSRDA